MGQKLSPLGPQIGMYLFSINYLIIGIPTSDPYPFI